MIRSRRSVLLLPASSRHMAEKASTLDADEVVLDLEDAVAGDRAAKASAREQLVRSVRELDFHSRTLAVRINRVGGPYSLEDLECVWRQVGAKIATLVVPKVSSPAQVTFLDLLLQSLEAEVSNPPRLGLELQIEDPQGLEAVREIAGAASRTEALIFGPGDFAAAMGMPQLRIGAETAYPGDIWHYPLFQILAAARAHGLQAIDGPCSDIADVGGLRASAARAAQLGYDGKWVIHPSQLEAVNQAFTPSPEQVSHAEAILGALDRKGGASRLGGEMVDEAHRRMAQAVLRRARGTAPE
ncbi:MAG: HpcH/HpaI aldolase/citrate lyase family protein [Candidatus Dormibacteria bacterium]